jgi:nucleoside phosphorylase
MGVELASVQAMLDNIHPSLPTQRDQNSYTLGEMEGHKVVIAVLPEVGTGSAARVAIQLLNDFTSIRFGLLVGIGGGVPNGEEDGDDIRLGDVVVSKPTDTFDGVVQYNLGKETSSGLERTGTLNNPPVVLRSAIQQLVAQHEMEDSRIPQCLSKNSPR